ncbi:MAG: hypothetical protein DHS20C18_17670 [Saprospiraceae bacterium]|nr:MAG: hypothetical protein DHS20C18_17670 [Saprospiraceae bacterium]
MNRKLLTVLLPLFCWLSLPAQYYHAQQHPLPILNKEFSVVAHITLDTVGSAGITETEILESFDTLNYYFKPIGLSFEICEFRYIDNFQYNSPLNTNEWAEMQAKYHQNNRINVFFVGNISWAPDDCGYSTQAGITMTEKGGIMMKKPCTANIPKSVAHEFGHYFGLFNTNEGFGAELVNGENCESEGDLICDTPADPYITGDTLVGKYLLLEGCRFILPELDANGEFYRPHVANIMSYYPEDCKCGFSYQQYIRMVETYRMVEGMW